MPYKDHERQLQAQKDNYRKNKGKYYANMMSKRAKNKQWIAEFKAGKSCQCGEAHPACLEFHHLDPKSKDMSISDAAHHWGLKRIKKEVAKCIIICSNCHQKKHWDESH